MSIKPPTPNPRRPRRTKSEDTEHLLNLCFEGEDVDKVLAGLSDHARAIFYRDFAQLKKSDQVACEKSTVIDYIKPPPTMAQFIDDDYYLGKTLRPSEENVGIFPLWREILCRDFDLDSRIHNVVVTGSLGVGKTWVAVTILLYRIVLASLLRNPQHFFGVSRGSAIIYNILSVTREQVKQTAFGDAINFMASSPYFLEECKFNPEMEYSKAIIPVRNSIYLTAGSKGWHVLGRNVPGVLLDEGNFRLEKEPDRAAYALFDQVRTRISNRFQKIEGFLPAISIVASSASDESSFTEQVIAEIEKVNNPATQVVYRNSVYKVKRHVLKLGPRWFKVAYGLKNIDPYILAGWYLEDGSKIADGHEEPPPAARIELVPEMYWPDFRRNCRTQLQAVSGIATGGSHRLFGSMVDFERCIELSEKEGVINPALVELMPVSNEDNVQIWDYLKHSVFATKVASHVQPKRHPNALRYAHLDLATSTKAGLSICHLVGHQRVEGVVKDGEPFEQYRLIVEYDFILTIIAGQTKSISFDKITKFFFWLRDMCGFRFGLVTADMFQSHMPLQNLEAQGFKVDRLSLDKDKSVYNAWRSGFEDQRVRLYRQQELMREAESLQEGDKKYDHTDTGSKDTSDGAAGSYYGAINSDERTTLLTQATPAIHTSNTIDSALVKPVMEIPLPERTRRLVKTYDA